MKSREIVRGESESRELIVSYEKQHLTHLYHDWVKWLKFWRKRPALDLLELILESKDSLLTVGIVRSGSG